MKASEELRKVINLVREAGENGWNQIDTRNGFHGVNRDSCCIMIRAWNNKLLVQCSFDNFSNILKVQAAAQKLGYRDMFYLNDSSENFDHMLMRAYYVVNQLESEERNESL